MKLEPLPTEMRPVPALLKYYILSSLVAGPFFVFPLIVLFARFRTLRYRLDDDGISMRWGVLFRREVSLNYRRIQDIHLSSNVVERWLGLGKIQVQTASASSKAEMTIEGVPDLQQVRDFLYGRMRGARGNGEIGAGARGADHVAAPAAGEGPDGELARVLRDVAAEVRALRETLEATQGGDTDA
jgi:putative membrane protein